MKSSPASQPRERLLAVALVTVVQGVPDVALVTVAQGVPDVVGMVGGSLLYCKIRRSSC